ncbi:ParA family protein [Bacillus sp. BRMEA1]|uniref:ParA family protein n=1 Tax=Neobacillus endophyticus TaxID=2738405 RepID=UPI001564A910|nr:ParA family protein [Neobacillus endophyticus]NRD80834.1 ParA family protein [Neobacillus endophyticus]
MILTVISKNTLYKELFSKESEIEQVLLWNELKSPTVDVKAVLLDGDIVDIEHLEAIREVFKQQSIFYKPKSVNSDAVMKSITRLCAAHKVTLLNEHLTVQQVVEKLLNQITDREDYLSKRIISFFGTHSGAGVSTTVLNLARSLSKQVEGRVLVLSLNTWDPCDYFYHYQGHYLNDLKVDLKTQNLTKYRLSEAVYYHEGFYHLAGNRDIKMQRFYQPSEIEHLLKVAKATFDVILIDGGTHFDSAGTVQAFLSSNLKFLVTNQEEKGYRGYYPYVFQQLIEPAGGKAEDFMLVINRFQPSNTMITEKALEDELNMTRVATIPDMGDLGTLSAYQKKLLYDMTDSFYQKNIDLISNLIISEARLKEKPIEEEKKQKKGIFGIFT